MGFIPVDEQFRHTEHPDMFAAGVAIAIAPPAPTPVPAGVPKTGQMTETMAKVAVAQHRRRHRRHRPATRSRSATSTRCASSTPATTAMIFKASHVLSANGNGKHAHVMAGPQAHWAKVAFEHVFIDSRKRGLLAL